jgi:hypothetical protein
MEINIDTYIEIPRVASMHMCITTHIGSSIAAYSASLVLLYPLLYSEHIKHIQVLGFLPLYSYRSMILKKQRKLTLNYLHMKGSSPSVEHELLSIKREQDTCKSLRIFKTKLKKYKPPLDIYKRIL